MQKFTLKRVVAFASLLFTTQISFGQGAPDPCSGDGPGCQNGGGDFLMTSELDKAIVNQPEGFFVAVGNSSTMKIDTSYSGSYTLTKLDGPGNMTGTLSNNFSKYAYIADLTFDAIGNYNIEVDVPGIGKDTVVAIVGDGNNNNNNNGGGGQNYDPCAQNPGCTNGGGDSLFITKFDTAEVFNHNNVVVGAAVTASGKVDTTYSGSVTLSKLDGPGNFTGSLTRQYVGYTEFNDLQFDATGTYLIEFDASPLGKDTLTVVVVEGENNGGGNQHNDPCTNGPGCVNTGGTDIFISGVDTVIEKQPTNYTAGAWDPANMKIDTSYTGNFSIVKLDGPGNVNGDLSISVVKWGNGNIEFDTVGTYMLELSLDGIGKDTITVVVVEDNNNNNNNGGNNGGNNNGQQCMTSTKGDRENLGLYGGSSIDLSFNENGRLFGAISTPASLFITDDTAKTWYAAFPADSLEFDCDRGWGGRALRVLTNQSDWVGVQTSQEQGTLTAAVISYANGDTGTWKTAFDGYISQHQFNGQSFDQVKCIDLTDYNFYVGSGKSVFAINQSTSQKLFDVSSIHQNAAVLKIAATNNNTGYPMYLAVDTTNNPNSSEAAFYKYDGSSFTALTPPGAGTGIANVFVSNGHTSGDTVFVTIQGIGGKEEFRSYDGGSNWTDLSMSSGWGLSDVDYLPNIAGTKGDGTVLIIPGDAISFDLGNTWENMQLQNNGVAVYPNNPDVMVGTVGRGVVVSYAGSQGTFSVADNYGLEAVKINQVARSEDKSVFYVATGAGLAYTTKYLDENMNNFDKWQAPNGEFPISGAGDDAGLTSVAIDPNNSNHVIAGYSNGFTVTHTGVSGFSNVQPADWNSGNSDPSVQDIVFINSNTVVAVTGGGNGGLSGNAGNIYRSTDGGDSWTQVTPSGFYFGNSLAVGSNGTDTVIYAGCGSELSMDPTAKGALWKSTDKGATWSKVNSGPDAVNASSTELPIFDVAVDPRGTDTVYVCAGSNLDNAFVVSTDGGSSYNTVDVTGEGAFTSVMINLDAPDTVYTAIRRELYVYDLVNDTAVLAFRGLPGELIPDLVYGSVIAGSSTGMWKLDLDAEPNVVTSTSEVQKVVNQGISIYPNPNNGSFNVQFENGFESLNRIAVMDYTGKIVFSANYNQNMSKNAVVNINSEHLSQGTYILLVQGAQQNISTRITVLK